MGVNFDMVILANSEAMHVFFFLPLYEICVGKANAASYLQQLGPPSISHMHPPLCLPKFHYNKLMYN